MPDLTGDTVNDINLTNTTVGGTPTVMRTVINGAVFQVAAGLGSGTGGYNTFFALSDNNDSNSYQQGFNSNESNPLNTGNGNYELDVLKTKTVLLSSIPVTVGTGTGPGGNGGEIGVQYYEIRLDLNESNSTPYISLDKFQLYLSGSSTIVDDDVLFAQNKIYDMDAGGNVSVLLKDGNSGSGVDDYIFLVPVSTIPAGTDPAQTYLYLYTQMGIAGGTTTSTWSAEGGFEEFNLQTAATVTGVKFNDLDNDGARDAGENGVQGVTIFIDADADGNLDAGERSTITDANGNYYFYGMTAGTYTIDEVKPTADTIQTTGANETITLAPGFSAGQVFTVDPIGNHVPVPEFTVTKTATSITGGLGSNGLSGANNAGDTVNYTIVVTNTGELALTGYSINDPNATNLTRISGDGNNNNILDVGETWTYTAQHVVTQLEIDGRGTSATGATDGDGDTDNTVTVTTTNAGTKSADASTPVLSTASIGIVKTFVGFTGGDGDQIGDAAGDELNYTVTVTNTGNMTLTNTLVTDPLTGLSQTIATLAPGQSQVSTNSISSPRPTSTARAPPFRVTPPPTATWITPPRQIPPKRGRRAPASPCRWSTIHRSPSTRCSSAGPTTAPPATRSATSRSTP